MRRSRPPIFAMAVMFAASARADLGPSPHAGTETRALGAPAEHSGPGAPEAGNGGGSTIPATLAVLALILGLGLAWRQIARRGGLLGALGAGGRAPAGVVEVLARYPVGRGQTLVLIKLDRRILVASHSGTGLRTLCDITDPDEVASLLVKTRDDESASLDARFRGMLDRFSRLPQASPGGEAIPIVDLTRDPPARSRPAGRVA